MDENKKKVALLTIAAGFWLIAVPLTFEFKSRVLFWNDLISGLFLIILSALSLAPQRVWSGWGIALLGIWLQLAPLAFWAPCALNYLNDTLIGILLIAFSFYLTRQDSSVSDEGANIPEGWSYNPSAWMPRILTVGLAMVCWSLARYMAAYQLGYIDEIWDPVFGKGTLDVITSKVSHDFPVSDAGLGALSYTLEFLLGWHGGSARWRTMPWLVLTFGFLVVPVGLVSIILIVLQPVAVGAWCFWCLLTAVCMLFMILLSGAEIIATLTFLRKGVQEGESLWKLLWNGKKMVKAGALTPPRQRRTDQVAWGFFPCWNLTLTALVGIYLMFSPYLFSSQGILAMIEYIIGPFMVTFSVVAMVEVYRAIRFVNIFLAVALLCIALIWPELQGGATWNAIIVSLVALLVAWRRGLIRERYGSWERCIF
jgi:hypothetical protein